MKIHLFSFTSKQKYTVDLLYSLLLANNLFYFFTFVLSDWGGGRQCHHL